MSPDELQQISNQLTDQIDRFGSLYAHPVHSAPPWPTISNCLSDSHIYIRKITKAFATSLTNDRSRLQSDTKSYQQWRAQVKLIWSSLDYLRQLHRRLFSNDYMSLIYHHVFVDELFQCLPDQIAGARSRFLLEPSGDVAVQKLNEMLVELGPYWFDQKSLEPFRQVLADTSIAIFECHRERDFVRQTILAHEIIHVLMWCNPQLDEALEALANTELGARVTTTSPINERVRQLREFFCDFAAAWHYGPAYLQAFADEMSYYPEHGSPTHPAGHARARLLLSESSVFDSHQGYKRLKQYLDIRGQTHPPFPSDANLKKIGREFRRTLQVLGLTPYQPKDYSLQINRSFRYNVPFVAMDIRDLINSLPSREDAIQFPRYSELVSESLRKTSLLRQVKEHGMDREALFAIPGALS